MAIFPPEGEVDEPVPNYRKEMWATQNVLLSIFICCVALIIDICIKAK